MLFVTSATSVSSEGNRKEAVLESSKEEVKKAKSSSLMQEMTAFLTSCYRFRYNVLTEETEVAEVTNNIPDTHLRYTKVDERLSLIHISMRRILLILLNSNYLAGL